MLVLQLVPSFVVGVHARMCAYTYTQAHTQNLCLGYPFVSLRETGVFSEKKTYCLHVHKASLAVKLNCTKIQCNSLISRNNPI